MTLRFRYQDPSKIPKWKRYSRYAFLFIAWNAIAIYGGTLLLSGDRSNKLSSLNEKYRAMMLNSGGNFGRNREGTKIKMKGLSVENIERSDGELAVSK